MLSIHKDTGSPVRNTRLFFFSRCSCVKGPPGYQTPIDKMLCQRFLLELNCCWIVSCQCCVWRYWLEWNCSNHFNRSFTRIGLLSGDRLCPNHPKDLTAAEQNTSGCKTLRVCTYQLLNSRHAASLNCPITCPVSNMTEWWFTFMTWPIWYKL